MINKNMETAYKVILFYKFINLDNPEAVRDEQRALCQSLNLKGRILVGAEGINGTLEGSSTDTDKYRQAMAADSRFADMAIKESAGTGKAFAKLKVKVREEIVTLGAGRFDVARETAPELSAEELAELYKNNDDFVILDLRNDYEVKAGYFDKTVNPELRNFRDLTTKIKELAHLKDKKVVSVCTGGIRCEKATCLLKREGFNNIYQLKNGIHDYMVKYPGQNFKGTLFVFDDRMVTDVVPEISNKVVVGRCSYCGAASESFYNDDSYSPSLKIIACEQCFAINAASLRPVVANTKL